MNRKTRAFRLLPVLALTLFQILVSVAPPANGLITILAIGLPYLYILVIPYVIWALFSPARDTRLAVSACLLVYLASYLPGMVPRVSAGPVHTLTIEAGSWNTLFWNESPEKVTDTIANVQVEVLSLVELSTSQANAILADPRISARFPYHALHPDPRNWRGIGLLSAYPILETGHNVSPPATWARISVNGSPVFVMAAHPPPAAISSLNIGRWPLIPYDYKASTRDAQIATIVQLAETESRGAPVLLMGDFNVTEREAGYRILTRSLVDSHRAVGFGPGNTWKSERLITTPVAIIRIDYLLTGRYVTPLTIREDCTASGSDHCLVAGTFAVASSQP